MAGHFQAAPLARQVAACIKCKRAALDAAHLPAVKIFHLDDSEEFAGSFFLVRQQIERELHLRLETFMRLEAIARDSEYRAFQFLELRIEIAEVLAFGGAARC